MASQRQNLANDRAALKAIQGLGVQVAPFDLPDLPVQAISFIPGTEAAAAFDMPTLIGLDKVPPAEKPWYDDAFVEGRNLPVPLNRHSIS